MAPPVVGAIVVTVLAWASAFIVIRGTGPYFSGGALALGRLLVGSALLSLVMVGRRWVRPTPREWLLVGAFGVAWFGAYNVALNIAEHTLDAGTTAMVVNTGPILIALGAGWILREGIPKWLAIGAGVAFVGVVCIGLGTGAAGLGSGAGVLWALVAAVTYSAGVLFQKPALRRLPAAQVTWLGCVAGTIACLPFAGDLVAGVTAAPPAALLGVVYLGAVPTALAFSTWAYALARMPAGQLGISTYVVPPLAILLGFLAFAEVPAPLAMAGGAVCLAGVALSRRRA
ncbi:MAG: DMT family transporter [Propionibacteriaceae bacterium]|nr:DMT family transporter [Propionibacteriaceae bacterium]